MHFGMCEVSVLNAIYMYIMEVFVYAIPDKVEAGCGRWSPC